MSCETLAPLTQLIPDEVSEDTIFEAFWQHLDNIDLEPYPAQEEAILELLSENNVILATPTGSGKSLVALAAHFAALAKGQRSFYTAPIKALVTEKFFSLCRSFGKDNVGMVTGDGSINADAPIVCATQEILANMALRGGVETGVDVVIADEFHYYSESQRGWAWQVPLLEMTDAQFLLMSATLGDTTFFEEDLTTRTGRETALISSDQRPVPLRYQYRETPLLESVQELIDADRAPIYIVYFTQREATEAAQSFTSLALSSKSEKAAIADELKGFRFDSPIGKDLRRFLSHGIGVHHAGLLPKYRLLIERLAQKGLLKLICGTDTLGVGVNVPIRAVLLTQLFKYDGIRTRVLKVREFKQIAGRAGRRGFDDVGDVWAQAPVHVVENLKAEAKAGNDPKKRRKISKKKPPERGYAHYSEDTFDKLRNGQPEALTSSFAVSHHMMLNVLDRSGDGCKAMRRLLTDNHESRKKQRKHIRDAVSIYRSLLDAELLETLDTPDDRGRTVRIHLDLQDEFALTQPLSLFALEVIETLDSEQVSHTLDVLSVIEAVTDSPGVVIAAQINKIKSDLMTEMKLDGIEYEERMQRLEEAEAPKPLADFLYPAFEIFSRHHPWVGYDTIKPKSIVRELYEQAMTFGEYVNHYSLKRSEGVLLRYLSQIYRGLIQNIPEAEKTDEIYDLTDWLGEVVKQIDSSLIDEWNRTDENLDEGDSSDSDDTDSGDRGDITKRKAAFKIMVRNSAFRWIRNLVQKDYTTLCERSSIRPGEVETLFEAFYDEHDHIESGPDARGPDLFSYDTETQTVRQIILDSQDSHEWQLIGKVDLESSREVGDAVLVLENVMNPHE